MFLHVLVHEFEGQFHEISIACALLLEGDNPIARIVAAGFLQLPILFKSEEGSGLGEGVAQFDGAVFGVDGNSVHFSILSGLLLRFSFRLIIWFRVCFRFPQPSITF